MADIIPTTEVSVSHLTSSRTPEWTAMPGLRSLRSDGGPQTMTGGLLDRLVPAGTIFARGLDSLRAFPYSAIL